MFNPCARFVVSSAIAVVALVQPALASPPAPLLVSPGAELAVTILDECPTFSWAPRGRVESLEIVVAVGVQVNGQQRQYQPVLRAILPGSASSWTPPLESCLQIGMPYAWMARGHSGELAGKWSEVNRFSVSRPGSIAPLHEPISPFSHDRRAWAGPADVEPLDPEGITSAGVDWSSVKTYEIAAWPAESQDGSAASFLSEDIEPSSRVSRPAETPDGPLPKAFPPGYDSPAMWVTGDPALVLLDSDEGGDNGAIFSDPNKTSSDLFIYSNDNIQFYVDQDNNELGVFAFIGTPGSCQIVNGDLSCSGTKSAVVEIDDEQRLVYAIESPEVWFEDFGRATLDHGSAFVEIDPMFAAAINLEEYHVFLTPLGDCRGLFVSEKSHRGFKVQELGGRLSSVSFDYRVVGRRLGFEDRRLEVVDNQTD